MQLTTEFQKILETSTKVTQNVTGYLRLYLKYGGRDVANNKDIIYYEIRQYAYNPYGNYDAWSWNGSYPFNITNEKGTLASGSYTQSAIKSDGTEKVRASGSWEQEHNQDGTWSSKINFDGYVYKTKLSTSGNITLPTIPRRTTISATDSKIGSISTIYLKINSSSFNHYLSWRYPNEDVWSIIATNVKENYQWKVPDEVYEAIPNSKSIELTILCETYNTDGSLVGTDETTMWASVNEEVARPTLSVTIKNDGTSGTTYELTGSETAFIKDYTNAIIDANVVVKKSAKLQEYKVVNGNKSSNAQDTTINTISTGKFSFFVKDSRQLSPSTGYQTDKYVDTFIEYFAPKVLTPTIERTEQTSTEVIATLSGTYWNGNFGAITNVGSLKYSWRSKLAGSNEWGGWSSWASPTINGANFSINELSLGTTYATNSSYDFQFRFMDALSNLDSSKIVTTSTQNVTISTPIIEVYEDEVNVNGNILKNGVNVPMAQNSYSTSTIDTYSCNYINRIKNIITASNSSDGDEVTAYGMNYLTLNSSISTGSKFSLVDGKVKIGNGVSKIMVSGLVRYYYKNNKASNKYELGAYIYNNDSVVVSCRLTVPASGENISDTIVLTPRIITAKKNDLISLAFYSTTGQITRKYLSSSYLTVEVIE